MIPKGLSSASVDVTDISSLRPVLQEATTVVSLVGILRGSVTQFEAVQWKGAENVAAVAEEVGAKVIHISAIGADPNSHLISPRTKGLGEQSVLRVSPTATIIRPSLIFGPGDSFFAVSSSFLYIHLRLLKLLSVLQPCRVSYLSCPSLEAAGQDFNPSM